ncbi:MAG: hypothetical protein NTW50_02845 [Candidatus Berkelbacteria bacterium]|nr:hypothetical protein [Candidatus Berkelbacteria bacterium]
MKYLKEKINRLCIYFAVAALLFASLNPELALANVSAGTFTGSGLNNNLISNTDFLAYDSMTVDQIQSFLASHNSVLTNYSDGGRSAAQIILDASYGRYDAAGTWNGIVINESTHTVSPKVLLVVLQKEQSLITQSSVGDRAIYAAMGCYCYNGVSGDNNGNGCKDSTEGFSKQVENGAWLLRYSYERAQGKGLDYQVGQEFTTSDGYNVKLLNAATASLYRYTPYVFNGNFNFYNYYNTWFVAHPDTNTNDQTPFTLKTYVNTQKLSGYKTSDAKAYLGGQLLADTGSTTWELNLTSLAFGTNNYSVTYKSGDGTTLGSKSIVIVVQKPGDIDGSGTVGLQDLSVLAGYWGQTSPEEPLSDLNGDHVVDIQDLSILAGYWGQ